jgi:hypothetical protein
MRAGTLAKLGAMLLLGGCGLVPSIAKQNEGLVSAEPLAVTATQLQAAAASTAKKEFIGQVVYESEQKCTAFLNQLTLARNTINTTGDILSAGLSGVGALVTPLSTAHALSGAATFVTGSKAAINSDIYANASLTNFQRAIQQTYTTQMLDYTTQLPGLPDNLLVSNEVAKIQSIHALCALAPAEATIEATLSTQPKAPPPPPPPPPAAPMLMAPMPGAPPSPNATHGAVSGAPLR